MKLDMTEFLFYGGSLVLSILLGMFIIPKILLISYKKKMFDLPDGRKVHTMPIPRLGGLSFFPVILITLCMTMGICYFPGVHFHPDDSVRMLYSFCFLSVGCMLLYLVGVTDDLIGVGYRYKFLCQIVAALLLALSGEWLNSLGGLLGIHALPPAVGMAITVFIVIYITNAINLIDGIDGLASGLSCIALAVLAIMYALRGEFIYVVLSLSTLGILTPFWFYNVFGNARRGHKLFMGDTGSLTLGYVLSILVIHLSAAPPSEGKSEASDMVIAFSTLLVPLLDVARVVLHRLRNHKNPFLPDKNHIHHKLIRAGLRVRSTMVCILLISLIFIGMNLWLVDFLDINVLLIADIVLWTFMHLAINHRIKIKEKGKLKRTV